MLAIRLSTRNSKYKWLIFSAKRLNTSGLSLKRIFFLAGLILVSDSALSVDEGAEPLSLKSSTVKSNTVKPYRVKESTFSQSLTPGKFLLPAKEGWWNWGMAPMALSLGFGILFTTLVCLLVLPCLYLVINKKTIKNAEDSQRDHQVLIHGKVL